MSMLSTRISNKLINTLLIEEHYTIEEIAQLLEVEYSAALRKGVLNRTKENAIVLLINLEKRKGATPYVDHIDNDVLYWEGQLKNRFVERNMNSGEYEIFVFIRHTLSERSYKYYGRALPIASIYNPPGIPCKTKFSLFEYAQTVAFQDAFSGNEAFDQRATRNYSQSTTRLATVEQRNVQQQYRRQALQLWNNRCAVLGIEQPKILIASHIKPWRVSDSFERTDARNSLILSPVYDKLFDLGMITFNGSNGSIKLSTQLSANDFDRLGIDDTKKLITVPSGTERYLEYHDTYVFDFAPCIETELKNLIS
jgi:hypothetical protein